MAVATTKPSPGRYLTGAVEGHQTQTGNTIQIQIDGVVVGRIQSLSFREGWGTEPIYEIGSMLPAELVPMQWRGTITVDKYRLRKQAFEKLPIKYGEDILKQKLFDIVILDKTDGSIIEKFMGCVQSDVSSSQAANRPGTQNITFLFQQHLSAEDVQNASKTQQ